MKLTELAVTILVAYSLLGSAPAAAAGDATHGKIVFARCAACHSMEPGKKMIGPSLAGVFGRKAGSLGGYAFSPAMKKYDKVWDRKAMDAFLTAPTKTVPGTRMVFPGLSNPADRADLLAYLQATPR